MKDYKQYNSTVKSVQLACEQSNNGYYLSKSDLQALKDAIADLQHLYVSESLKEIK